ncbi:unnamed protein product [Sphagnum balticum]
MLNSPDNVQTFSELKHLAIDKDQLADDILTYRKANAAEITPDEKLYLTTIFGELVSSAEGDMHRAVQAAVKGYHYSRHRPEETTLYKINTLQNHPKQLALVSGAGRARHRLPTAGFRRQRVRRVSALRDSGPRILARPMRIVPCRTPGRLQLQAQRLLPKLRRQAHERDRGPSC